MPIENREDLATMVREAGSDRSRIDLMGLPIDSYTPEGLVVELLARSRAGEGGYLMTPNLDNMRTVVLNPEAREFAMSADIRVADGMPLVWASRIQGTPLPGRVAGSDLIWSLSRAMAGSGRSLFLLGGEPGTADRAAEVLRQGSPELTVAGTYCPPFGFERDPAEMARISAVLAEAKPDFVFVGLPFPKACKLVEAVRYQLPGTWFLGLGVSFSFVCGDVRRAPKWMQRCGVEWVHRLLQEPKRLGRRYLLECLPFMGRLIASAVHQRARPVQEGGAR